jgi:chemotaxis regulatin CheY-phosphate phosphatase CheZ
MENSNGSANHNNEESKSPSLNGMHTENMNELFVKLNDLKSVFRYGQKLIPIIQSLLDFMKETAPLLESINHSITDSTNKIPKATHQINNVTNATEIATTEILDIVDLISNDILGIEKNLDEISLVEKQKSEILKRLKSFNLPVEASNLIDEYERINNTSSAQEKVYELTEKIKNNTNNIALSLQVQDITSQQLAAVNHLITSVQDKLSSLVHNLDDSNSSDFWNMEIKVPKDSHFDPNASYSRSDNRQESVDSIMNDQMKKTTQAEIDKLFS